MDRALFFANCESSEEGPEGHEQYDYRPENVRTAELFANASPVDEIHGQERPQDSPSASQRKAGAGDLLLTLLVEDHPTLKREGIDLAAQVRIGPIDAMLGTRVAIDGLAGSLRVTVPPGVSSGKKLRLSGQGIRRGKKTGDLLVEVTIDASGIELSERARGLAEQLRDELAREPVDSD